MKHNIFVVALLMAVNSAHAELSPITNDEMDAEVGQSGVAISLEMRLNADASGNSLCGTVALPLIECRLAIGVNNRGRPTIDQEWLVFKGVYGRIYIPYLTIDADSVTYTSDVDGSSQNVAAVKLGFGGAANKVEFNNFTISNISVERDTSAVARGYVAASEDGFLGLQINGNVDFSGSLKMFACNANHPRC